MRILAAVEQLSIRFADRVITCTEQMRETFVAGAARTADKIAVVLNSADEEHLRRDPPPASRVGAPTASRSSATAPSSTATASTRCSGRRPLLRDDIPGLRVEIFGDGTYRSEVERLCDELGLDGSVRMSDGWAPIEQLVAGIADADVGVVALRRNVFRDLTHCNKMFDFIAMRRPVVSRTRAVEAYFPESCFALFESGDERDLARAIFDLRRSGPGRAARREGRRGERALPLGAAARAVPARGRRSAA